MNIPWSPNPPDTHTPSHEEDEIAEELDKVEDEPGLQSSSETSFIEEDEDEGLTEEEEDFEEDEQPSLAEIHEEIAASSTESRRTARRLLDAMKQIGGVLEAVSGTLGEIHRSTREPARPSGDATKSLLLGLIELADRVERIRPSLSTEPQSAAAWWPGAEKTIAAWRTDRTRITDAVSIFDTHLHGMLQQAGLEKIAALGSPFDPSCMTAVEAVSDSSKPDHTVVGESLPGWRVARTGEVLRPAQVRVSRLP